jgi:shikimate dehydrogenase
MMISGKAVLAGVMGWPIHHSQSPRLHGFWLDKYEIDGVYVPLHVNPDEFERAFRALPTLGFAGVNITVPHKEMALKLVDHLDPAAEQIGAVNTVAISEDGQLTGYNTDGFGFIENLSQGCPEHDLTAGPAVVLGAGGAARAIVFSLLEAGVPEVRLINRTRDRAQLLANTLTGPIGVFEFTDLERAFDDANLLVNTTSLGMQGNPPLNIDLRALPSGALVNDIVYTPLNTDLLNSAKARGNPAVDGLGMLLHQARAGFEKWFGLLPDVTDDLRQHVLKGING